MRGLIPLIYYSGVPNVGDLANADLISAISGNDPYQTRNIESPHLVAIGSNMEWTYPASIVWGTGVMDPSAAIGRLHRENVYALRGKLTQDCLAAQGLACDVPLGDPAFLLPRILGISSNTPTTEMGIVPHYVDRKHALVENLIHNHGVRLLDVCTLGVPEFIKAMSQCKSIVSSSLHGLIFAEALGIPNLWIELSNSVLGGGYKFRDWFSTCHGSQNEPYRPISLNTYHELYARCEIHDCAISHKYLIENFPLTDLLRAGAVHPPVLRLRNYKSCRDHGMLLFIDVRSLTDVCALRTTIESAACKWKSLNVYLVGNRSEEIFHSKSDLAKIHQVVEPLGITDDFMKSFWDSWAEPQQHAVAEAGFDFSTVDVEREIASMFVSRPEVQTLTLSVGGRTSIHRRAGRWW